MRKRIGLVFVSLILLAGEAFGGGKVSGRRTGFWYVREREKAM